MIDPFGLCGENANDRGQKSKYEKWHNLLGAAGIFQDGLDLINGALYAAEGDYVNAAISFACGIPAVGTVIARVAKASKAMLKLKTAVKESAGKLANQFRKGFGTSGHMNRNRGFVINPFYKGVSEIHGIVNGKTPASRFADKLRGLSNSKRPNTVAVV